MERYKVNPRTALYVIFGSIIFTIIFIIISANQSRSASNIYPIMGNTDAFLVAKEFVSQKLKAPSTAKFPNSNHAEIINTGYNRWRVTSYVDAQNTFGAMIRNNFTVLLSYNDSTNEWLLENISLK